MSNYVWSEELTVENVCITDNGQLITTDNLVRDYNQFLFEDKYNHRKIKLKRRDTIQIKIDKEYNIQALKLNKLLIFNCYPDHKQDNYKPGYWYKPSIIIEILRSTNSISILTDDGQHESFQNKIYNNINKDTFHIGDQIQLKHFKRLITGIKLNGDILFEFTNSDITTLRNKIKKFIQIEKDNQYQNFLDEKYDKLKEQIHPIHIPEMEAKHEKAKYDQKERDFEEYILFALVEGNKIAKHCKTLEKLEDFCQYSDIDKITEADLMHEYHNQGTISLAMSAAKEILIYESKNTQ